MRFYANVCCVGEVELVVSKYGGCVCFFGYLELSDHYFSLFVAKFSQSACDSNNCLEFGCKLGVGVASTANAKPYIGIYDLLWNPASFLLFEIREVRKVPQADVVTHSIPVDVSDSAIWTHSVAGLSWLQLHLLKVSDHSPNPFVDEPGPFRICRNACCVHRLKLHGPKR